MIKFLRGMLGAGLAALAFSILAIPVARAASECVEPLTCSVRCADMAKKANIEDPDAKADYIKTCKFVNCDANGYFVGSWGLYQQCLKTKEAESMSVEQKRAAAIAKYRKDKEKLNKPFTTNLEYGKDVKPGQRISANEKETIVVTFSDGDRVIIKPKSTVQVISETDYILKNGVCEFLIRNLRAKVNKKLEVRTPTAVLAVRGTEFLVDAKRTSTTVKLFEGSLEVANLKGDKKLILEPGYSVVVRKSGTISKPKAFDPEKVKRWEEPQAENPNE